MHRTYTTVHGPEGHVAVCTCGWRSRAAGCAGLAGALWDDHVEAVAVSDLRLAS